MKKLARIFVCGAILAMGAATVPAQGIKIDTTDIKAMFAVGATTTYRIDTTGTSANIGATGASSWDFSGLTITSRMSMKSVALASTPYAANFPAATHALSDTAFTYTFTDQTFGTILLKGTGYNYFALGTNLLDFGFKGAGSAYIFGNPYPAEGQWLKAPAGVYFSLPLEMTKTWTTKFDETLTGSANVPPFGTITVPPSVTSHNATYTVDAYGPLTVPGFPPVNALRIRKVDSLNTATNPNVRVSYMFLAKDGTSVQVTALDPNAPDNGTISIARTSTQWTAPTYTAVQAINNVPAVFGLRQNYPNPFNPATTIRFTLPVRQHVTLRVFNLLGGEVATLLNETVEAGESSVRFDAGRLASGVYLYKLQAGTMTQTRRMMLVK